MKHFLIILIISMCFIGCNSESKLSFTTVYTFIDITDSTTVRKSTILSSVSEIIGTIGVDTISGGYSGGEVKFFLLNDVSNSHSKKHILKRGEDGLLGQNPFDRLDEIRKFQEGVYKELNSILDQPQVEKQQSKIYQNICREMANLANTTSDRKIVVIFSDMLENSNLITFYGKGENQIRKQLDNIEDAYNKILIKDCQLPNLSDIEFYVISNRDKSNDEKINLAEKFWTSLFQIKDGTLYFDSELDLRN